MHHLRSLAVFLLFVLVIPLLAQDSQTNLPQLIRFSGSIGNPNPPSRTIGVTFALYKDNEGGAPVWQEVQNVTVDAAGHYSVRLGEATKGGVPLAVFASGEARWLGVQPEGQPELPRILLVSVPYAFKAGDAETLGGMPLSAFVLTPNHSETGTDSRPTTPEFAAKNRSQAAPNAPTTSQNFVAKFDASGIGLIDSSIFDNGKVGINTTSPASTLDVNGNATFRGFGTYFITPLNNGPIFNFQNHATPTAANWTFGVPGMANSTSMWIYDNVNKVAPLQIEQGSTANSVYIKKGGYVGVGTPNPGSRLTIAGMVESTAGGFKFPNASVQVKAGVTNVTVGGGITGGGVPDANGNVTLGTSSAVLQSRVTGTCPSGTAVGTIASNGSVTCNAASGGGSIALPYAGTAGDNPPTTQGVFKITDTTNGPANSHEGPPADTAVPGALVGVATGTGIVSGVIAKATGSDGVPLVALSSSATADEVPVIFSWSKATSGQSTLFDGMASSPDARGLDLSFDVTPEVVIRANVGHSTNSVTVLEVDGVGNTHVNGTFHAHGDISSNTSISAPTKNFKIDHPLDPGNKWLYHTSVESPDMKDLYDGTVVLDGSGQAWVAMPNWFQALNRDFRYQLTAIGSPGPGLYISHEISGNRFKIAGGKAGMKVSWQVTGVRQDAWAADNRNAVEEDKIGTEIGKYYHPKNVTPANSDANAATNTPH